MKNLRLKQNFNIRSGFKAANDAAIRAHFEKTDGDYLDEQGMIAMSRRAIFFLGNDF